MIPGSIRSTTEATHSRNQRDTRHVVMFRETIQSI